MVRLRMSRHSPQLSWRVASWMLGDGHPWWPTWSAVIDVHVRRSTHKRTRLLNATGRRYSRARKIDTGLTETLTKLARQPSCGIPSLPFDSVANVSPMTWFRPFTMQMHFFDILTRRRGLFVLQPLVIHCLSSARLQKYWCQCYDCAVKMKFIDSSLHRRWSRVHSTLSRCSYWRRWSMCCCHSWLWWYNASLREGQLPSSHRHAIVTPLLKSYRLDADELKNYRPVSNLLFISKLTERAMFTWLVSYLNENGMMPRLQSAYKRHHSTETALDMSDIFAAVDQQQVTLLGLLWAPHSTVSTMTSCYSDYEASFVIGGQAFSWIASFLQDQTQQVFYKRCLSEVPQLLFGIPQGSVLGPLLFLLYVSEMFDIVAEFGFTSHAFADDTQLYVSVPAVSCQEATERFVAALNGFVTGWPAVGWSSVKTRCPAIAERPHCRVHYSFRQK